MNNQYTGGIANRITSSRRRSRFQRTDLNYWIFEICRPFFCSIFDLTFINVPCLSLASSRFVILLTTNSLVYKRYGGTANPENICNKVLDCLYT